MSSMASAAANRGRRPLDSGESSWEAPEPDPKKQCKDFELRSYQVEVFEVAAQRNTIAVLDTGAGKTMISVMLIRRFGHEAVVAGDRRVIVFLAPTVHLVSQQYEVIKIHTDLEVSIYYGANKVDQWTAERWEKEISLHQVLIMTPQILLDAFRNAFFTLDVVHLLILDECHHATGNHPYSRIMKEFYHKSPHKPHVFGMTASPIIRKGVWSAVDCEDQFSELECILDSKIYTVEDRREIDLFVPAAKQSNRYYDPNTFSYEGLMVKLESIWNKFDALMVQLHETTSERHKNASDIIKASQKQLSNYYAKIVHCLDNLGLICAFEASKICMEAVHLPCTLEGCDFSRECLRLCNSFLEEVSLAIEESLPHDYELLLKTEEGCLEAMKLGCISPKLHELIKIFQSLGETNQVLCLIFIERIIASKVIEHLMKKISYLAHFKFSYLTGGGSSVDTLTPKLQKETLDLFRSGKVNLLFTTDVVEEGIHVPDCSCVIRFDLPKTVRSYVQSCGRARQAGSSYILMLERGNIEQRDLLLEVIRSKHSMIDTALSREPNASISKVDSNEDSDTYLVKSTGATVTRDSSISLVHKYCQNLPKDKYFTPKPSFKFSVYDGCYEYTLYLPPNAAFQTLVGPIHRNSYVAKQLVCLDACRKLHELGALNDHLLPVIEAPRESEVKENKESASGAGTTKRKELHGTTTVSALCGTWAHRKDGVTLQGYKLTFVCNKVGQNYSGFALLVDAILDEDVACTEMDLYLVNKMVKAYVRPSGPVRLEVEQVEHAKLFQEFFFNGLFGKLFIGSKSGEKRKFLLMGDNESLWSTSNMYLLLPLESSCVENPETISINWKAVNATASLVELIRTSFSPGSEVSLASSSSLSSTEQGELNVIYLANKVVRHQNVKDMVVIAIHTGKIYTVLEVVNNSSADSQFDGASDKKSAGFTTFSEYFNKRYGIVLQHPGQPLLLLKQSHNPHNLLSLKSKDEGDSSSKKRSHNGTPIPKPQSHVRMPPELLIHVGVQLDVLKSFYLLPSLMHRLESLMLASQLRKDIAFYSSDACIPSGLILEAITTVRCCEDFSLERLEHLGDSVLKYAVSCHLYLTFPEKHEGQLTACRSNLVCNVTLHHLGMERNVQGYVRDAIFDPRRWAAPGQLSLHLAPCTCGVNTSQMPLKMIYQKEDKAIKIGKASDSGMIYEKEGKLIKIGKACDSGHRWMCSKTISDCVEALIGAYYVGGGLKAAIAVLKWLGIDAEFEPEMIEKAMTTISGWSCIPKVNEIEILESKLRYSFTNKGLLLEAITHASQQESGISYCYQRLEFLGDSVLDVLITQHLFQKHKDIDPGELTDLRSASVNNENFAQAAVKHKLQQHLQHGSGLLLRQITEYAKLLEEAHENKNLLFSDSSPKGPSVLADLVESIAGAILIDTKLSLDKVWKIFEPLLSPIVTLENLELPSFRELSELCSERGYFIDTKCSNKGENVVATLEVQLEDVRLSRQACEKNTKSAKAQAALLLLKDMEDKGLSHSRHPSKRRHIDNSSVDEEKNVNSGGQNVSVHQSTESDSNLEVKSPVVLQVKMHKGGPRMALYELCKKSLWPMPRFESREEKSSGKGAPIEGPAGKVLLHSFVSTIILYLPNSICIECVGERRPDKKSSQDSAVMALLYELQKQGRVQIEEA